MEAILARTGPFCLPRAEGSAGAALWTNRPLISVIAILLALLHAALAITASIEKSPTFDEPTHLAAGYSYWLRNDFRLDPENGSFSSRWAALPLLVSRPNFPSAENLSWQQGAAGPVSEQFFYRAGNDSDRLLLQGRMMIAALSATLCLLIFFCSKRLFGPIGGLISESLAVFDPNLLAHGALITGDVVAAFFFTAATWSYWRMLQRVTTRSFALSALSAAGLFLAKMSGCLFLFLVAILSVIHIFSREPIALQIGRDRIVTGRWRKAATAMAFTSAIAAVVVLAIWASFSFRFAAFTDTGRARELWNARWDLLLAEQTPAEKILGFARAHRLLPEAYVYGFTHTQAHLIDRPAFLDGQWSDVGFRSFFPRAFCYKTPLPVLLLLALAALAAALRWGRSPTCRWKIVRRDLIRLSPIWTLAFVYGAFALMTNLNIGHRHLLPIYPAIFIACGAATYSFHAERTRLSAVLLVLLLGWQVLESFLIRPDYLAYFNQAAGGPANGYKRLVDSSLDWGQDLPALKGWLDQHNEKKDQVYLGYFGTAAPAWYGIHAITIPEASSDGALSPLAPGLYCISATVLQHVYAIEHGRWTQPYEAAYQNGRNWMRGYEKIDINAAIRGVSLEQSGQQARFQRARIFQRLRFGRLCAYLRSREPFANVGYSILVFRLTQSDLRDALEGPPAELPRVIDVGHPR